MKIHAKSSFAALAALFFVANAHASDSLTDGRIAIVDVSDSLLDHRSLPRDAVFEHLRNSGVLVIGRYFSRCQQFFKDKKTKKNVLWRKRLIDGDRKRPNAEAQAILKNGFAIMSIYQYNNRRGKFSGARYADCIKSKYPKEVSAATSNQAREGILDAEAALDQAKAVGQPDKTVIYFGVDYNFDEKNVAEQNGLLAYFKEVKKQFSRADYRIGAYASGDALRVLSGDNPQREKLIDIAWLLPSASFAGNSKFHSNEKWHIFQSQADNKILISNENKCLKIEYDTNIQNSAVASEDLGFWKEVGAYKVPVERTNEIFNQRRFVCDSRGLTLPPAVASCNGKTKPRSCKKGTSGEPCYARSVRVAPQKNQGGVLNIDFRDYGRFDENIEERRLTRSFGTKPLYERAPHDKNVCTNSD